MMKRFSDRMKQKEDVSILFFAVFCFILSRLLLLWVFYRETGYYGIRLAVDRYNIWDAAWYRQYISLLSEGKFFTEIPENGQVIWNFFPLYPMICAAANKLLPFLNEVQTGTAVSSFFMIASEFAAYRYIRMTRTDKSLPYLYILLFSFGPYSFYFSITYTESLFLFLLIMCFLEMRRKRYLRMGIYGAFMSMTRSVGILFAFSVLGFIVRDYLEERGDHKSLKDFFRKIFQNGELVLGTALIPLGLFAFMTFLKAGLGDGLAFVHSQVAWAKHWEGFFPLLISQFKEFPLPYYGAVMLFSFICLIVMLIDDKRIEEFLFPFLVLLISGSSDIGCIARYMMGSFTLFLFIVERLNKCRPYKKTMAFVLLAGTEITMAAAWLNITSLLR